MDEEEANTDSQRKEKLGFQPQKELVFNKLLPYAESIDQESQSYLCEIKSNLSKAVLLRELRPGCVAWTGRLNRYLNLYGFKFSKEDHVNFIKLYYELILIADLEASMISLFASTLNALMKKKNLIR